MMKLERQHLPLVTLLVSLLYFIAGEINFMLLSDQDIITIGIFIPEGIALATAIYFGTPAIFGIFIGQFFLAYGGGNLDAIISLEIATINSIEAMIGIYLFKKLKISQELKRFSDILKLAAIILFVLQPFSATFGNLALLYHHQTQESDFLFSTFSWWFGNTLGQFLVTPLVLLLLVNYKKIDSIKLFISALIYSLFLYIIMVVIQVENPFILMGLTFSILLFIILQLGIIDALFFIFITSMFASYSVYLKVAAFSVGSLETNTINYDLFILAHIVIVWLLGILFEERKENELLLHKKIEEAIEENKRKEILLQQQNRLAQMGELISMIAHQWRQPLNNLHLINQYLISKRRKKKLEDKDFDYFEKSSQEQINYMSNTINDFRNFFSIEDSMSNFSLIEVTNQVIKIIKPTVEANNIEIEFLTEKEYFTYGHKNSFAQVLINIINNSKDALIDTEQLEKRITIDILSTEDALTLTIRDNGGGIDAAILPKIFDPYFSTKKKNGTGLGLYMSKMIIEEQMRGELSVENLNDGASFSIKVKESEE